MDSLSTTKHHNNLPKPSSPEDHGYTIHRRRGVVRLGSSALPWNSPHLGRLIWLCGLISSMLVQPIVGYHNDRCTSRFGRRRPFIVAGALAVAIAVFLIGYAVDLGHIFVAIFWILDMANNMLQGPCRALLADLSAGDHRKMHNANTFFSFFMVVSNVLGTPRGPIAASTTSSERQNPRKQTDNEEWWRWEGLVVRRETRSFWGMRREKRVIRETWFRTGSERTEAIGSVQTSNFRPVRRKGGLLGISFTINRDNMSYMFRGPLESRHISLPKL